MDYRFFYNERQLPCARLSMDHEAFGLWLTDELGADTEQLSRLLQAISSLEQGQQTEFQWQGRDFLLRLTRDDAEVIALVLLQDHSLEELEGEDLEFYDAESFAACGLDDFKELLSEWQEFLLD
jgi:uncharacterized protein YacL (UPF0231 family)